MKKSKLLSILLLILCLTQFAKADVAPDADEMRMTADLIINTDTDLSDYKFFLAFAVSVRDVELKSKGNTVLESGGGGAAFSRGSLFAIQKRKLKEFGGEITAEQIKTLSGGNNIGAIELGKHQFSQTIKVSEREKWTYPTYKLEREGDVLKLTKLHDISPKISLEEESQINRGKYLTYTIIAGLLIALAILITGVFLFRKVLKKS